MALTEEELSLYELAFLLRTPVYKILEEMPFDEMIKWHEYLQVRPYGWREDRRTALTMSALGATVDINQTFPTLANLGRNVSETTTVKSLANSKFFDFMLNSSNGDKPDFLQEIAEQK